MAVPKTKKRRRKAKTHTLDKVRKERQLQLFDLRQEVSLNQWATQLTISRYYNQIHSGILFR